MKAKRILSVILAVAMILCSVSMTAFAEEQTYVAKIGTTEYASFSNAMTAANSASGAVEVEIYGAAEFTNGMELNGSYNSITFVGKDDDAVITINQSAGGDYLEAHGKTVAFTNLKLAKANPAWSGNSGHMGNYFSVQGGTATYTNCTFPNGACTSTGTATYTNCTFQNTSEYGLWVYDDAYVTVNGGTIDSAKGIKVYSEGETSVTSTLVVENATFTESVTAKPAVAIGYAESITLIGNTYNNTTGVLELDSGSDADCEGITFVAEDADGNDITSTLTAVDRSSGNAACGVFVTNSDGTTEIYTSVTTAAAAAVDGDTVTLLYDTEDEVTFAEGVTLETNGYTAENVTVAQPAGPVAVSNYDELKSALVNGGEIKFTADITVDTAITVQDDTIIDLNDKTLYVNVENSYYNNVTIKNGNIVLGKDDVHVCDGYFLVNAGKTLVLNDVNMSSSSGGIKGYAVFHLKTGANLDLIDSTLNISDNEYSAGYIVYAGESTATVDVTRTNVSGTNVNGIVHAATVIEGSSFTINDAVEHGINRSAVTIDNSTVTISGGTGRGITAQHGDLVIDGNSVVNISDMGEATIELRNNKNLIVAETATVTVDAAVNNTTSGTVSGNIVVKKVLTGQGTLESPYLINNIEDLKTLRDNVNNGNDYDGKYFKLMADIDLSSVENWVPIGVNGSHANEFSFRGYFDGNNKTISNLTIADTTSDEDKLGLFGHIHGDGMKNTLEPSVKNLYMTNVNISSTDSKSRIGALAGNPYTCYIENVHVAGTISGGKWTGGIAGNCYAVFENCSFTGTVDSNNQAGGIAGAGDARVYNSKSVGDITAKYWAGGIIGNGQEGASAVGCYAKGTITAENNWYFGVGGIAGVGGHGYAVSQYTDNYFDGEVYLCGEKVNAIVVGFINAENNEAINTTVDGNSWNTEYYSAKTPVVVTAEVDSDSSAEDWTASASQEKSSVRNNNLVMLESDLEYVDAATAEDVSIMTFSEVAEEAVAAAVSENKFKVFVDTNENGVWDDGETKYTDVQEAIVAAAPDGTVVFLRDATVETWVMFAETMSISNGNLITLNINDLTIEGNNNTLTIKGIESAGNGNRLFYDAQNLNIKDLTIEYIDDAANQGGIGLQSGTIKNVSFVGGGNAILPGVGNITIDGCDFATNGTAIYYEDARDNLVVTDCKFTQPEDVNVILLRGNTTFTNNTVNSGRTVNVVSGSPVVTGNDFGNVRFKVYNEAIATIENNEINVIAFKDESEVKSTFTNNKLSAAAYEALDKLVDLDESNTNVDGSAIEWIMDTDAGYYYVGETRYGMMRFLFAADIEGTIAEVGIKYIKTDDITSNVEGSAPEHTVSKAESTSAFYGDIHSIGADVDTKIYAKAYIKTSDDNIEWSDAVPCEANWETQLNYTVTQ